MATNNASQSININASLSQPPIFPVFSTTYSTLPFPFSISAHFTLSPTQQPIAISAAPPSLNSNRHPIVSSKPKAKKKARWKNKRKTVLLINLDRLDSIYSCGISECIYCLTSVGVTIMTSSHKSALGLPTKLAPYRSDTVYPAMIATTLSQYEYVLICDKSNIRVSGSPQLG
ncbi:hypothetical protein PHYBLDRAFT_62950 [Phycomyces blakesleeanus NRRL 1555(-)]|uniref:Uncharacterized protein n=1 Tax=Phycomyces blakesleeanus (strain ATCC 8743b / DSM 1359 / FGSC 10004 / NBRC 33097 / NRRL 1555) TaxID=763407 RepID=A0A167NXZ6_PHYB8|nr:hypothetical protein PHYBLDRAFT_62950 [Phycomyces blakesleeanus NRRL 1555(-)]OAD76856.1 hypothetical protein PHYBLDRAFT_62950 [Phycomyces blakesleeanus NRRL 1555(-)]|eukprot:XP_018294896.1 hypothetical protein PHYBLDRAFT_62950 [Phycomyces blakesleeanus NRRL 1555(-)]